MHYQLRVKHLHCLAHFLDQALRKALPQRLLGLARGILIHVARLHELGHDVVTLIIFKRLEELNYICAAALRKQLHDLQLFEDLVVLCVNFFNLWLVDELDGDFNPRVLVLREDDEAEGALAEPPDRFILVNAVRGVETLGAQDFLVPEALGLLRLEVDGALLLINRDQKQAMKQLGRL